MKIKFLAQIVLSVALIAIAPLQASVPATFVQYNAANATIGGGSDYLNLPITFSSSTVGRWNFDPTLTTPLVPATATTTAVYGGINVTATGTGTLASVPVARLHNNNPPGWPNAPKVYVYSNAGTTGVNSVNSLYVWRRADFTGNQSTYSAAFNSSSTLTVHITDNTATSPGDAMETRFIILNGSTYYVSEAKLATTGTFSLTNFVNNPASGFRWAPITLTSTSFDIPQSGLVYAAQTFGDVQAVGWIGRGSRNYTGLFAFDTFSATGLYSTPTMKLSMNLGGIASYCSSHPFLDIMKYSNTWYTHNADNIYGGPSDTTLTGYGLSVDSNNWPTKIPFVQTLITTPSSPYTGEQQDPRTTNPAMLSSYQIVSTAIIIYEGGRYRFRFRGTGSFSVRGLNTGSTTAFSQNFGPTVANTNYPGGISLSTLPLEADGVTRYWDSPAVTINPATGPGQISIAIYSSDPNSTGDYIRNFEILSPSTFTAGTAGDTLDRIAGPINPDLYATLNGFATFRMMDWGATNGSPVVNWTDRTLPSYRTQCNGKGIALEYQIAICNKKNANIWINVPHLATQDYVTKMAQVLYNGSKADGTPYIPGTDAPSTLVYPPLNSNLKVYIEYSNETWNSGFSAQYNYCQTQGLALGFPASLARDYYASYQSANIWSWFYQVWGADSQKRLVRVLGSQFSPGAAQNRLSAFYAGILAPAARSQYPDAVAVAPYFGGAVANSLVPTYVTADGTVNTATPSLIIGMAKADVEGNILTTINAVKTVANNYGVNLNCYEGGEGLVGTYQNADNTYLTTDLENANRDPGMGTLTTEYLGELQTAGVAEFCHFNHINAWSKYGTWGCIEYLGESTTLMPKYNSLVTYTTSFPNANSNIPPIVDLTSTLSGTVVPVPTQLVDTAGAGSVVVPLSTASSVDYDGTIANTQWIVNGVVQSTSANAISPSLPVGNNTITATVTDNSGASTSSTVQILVRPKLSDTVIVTSNFTGAGNNVPTPLTTSTPWTSTSLLASGLGYNGWGFHFSTTGVYSRVSDTDYPNAYRVQLMNPYGSGSATPELLTDAVTHDQYLSVTVTPPSGHYIDMRGAAVQWTLNNLGNTQSARQTALFTVPGSVFTAQPAVNTAVYDSSAQYPSGMSGPTTFTYYFPVTAANSNITTPTEFRIYLYNNQYGFKELQLTGFQLTGAIH